MNLKLKAVLYTCGLLAGAVLLAFGLEAIRSTFTTQEIIFGIQAICSAGLVYVVYSLVLAKLEMEEGLKKLTDSL